MNRQRCLDTNGFDKETGQIDPNTVILVKRTVEMEHCLECPLIDATMHQMRRSARITITCKVLFIVSIPAHSSLRPQKDKIDFERWEKVSEHELQAKNGSAIGYSKSAQATIPLVTCRQTVLLPSQGMLLLTADPVVVG